MHLLERRLETHWACFLADLCTLLRRQALHLHELAAGQGQQALLAEAGAPQQVLRDSGRAAFVAAGACEVLQLLGGPPQPQQLSDSGPVQRARQVHKLYLHQHFPNARDLSSAGLREEQQLEAFVASCTWPAAAMQAVLLALGETGCTLLGEAAEADEEAVAAVLQQLEAEGQPDVAAALQTVPSGQYLLPVLRYNLALWAAVFGGGVASSSAALQQLLLQGAAAPGTAAAGAADSAGPEPSDAQVVQQAWSDSGLERLSELFILGTLPDSQAGPRPRLENLAAMTASEQLRYLTQVYAAFNGRKDAHLARAEDACTGLGVASSAAGTTAVDLRGAAVVLYSQDVPGTSGRTLGVCTGPGQQPGTHRVQPLPQHLPLPSSKRKALGSSRAPATSGSAPLPPQQQQQALELGTGSMLLRIIPSATIGLKQDALDKFLQAPRLSGRARDAVCAAKCLLELRAGIRQLQGRYQARGLMPAFDSRLWKFWHVTCDKT